MVELDGKEELLSLFTLQDLMTLKSQNVVQPAKKFS